MRPPLLRSEVTEFPCRRGKVRDVYDLGDRLVIVATDRISAFDWVLPTPIPDKGRILTKMTDFWLDFLRVDDHRISSDLKDLPDPFRRDPERFEGRTMLVRKAEVVPVECVVRGYLSGSGLKEYRENGTVCGMPLPGGLVESGPLPEPIFTPATKAASGHDENVPFTKMLEQVGAETANELRDRSLDIYRRASDYSLQKGIILADTKFEFGRLPDGRLLLIDEVLTPDSSRFWSSEQYAAGRPQNSFDKQFVRDWLESVRWDKNSPPPSLPADVVANTRAKYLQALQRLAGKNLDLNES